MYTEKQVLLSTRTFSQNRVAYKAHVPTVPQDHKPCYCPFGHGTLGAYVDVERTTTHSTRSMDLSEFKRIMYNTTENYA